MKMSWKSPWCSVVALASLALTGSIEDAGAQTEFKSALERKYDRKITVSCNACHVLGEEKTARNDFGKLLVKQLDGKNVTKRLDGVKDLDLEDSVRVKVKEEVTAGCGLTAERKLTATFLFFEARSF